MSPPPVAAIVRAVRCRVAWLFVVLAALGCGERKSRHGPSNFVAAEVSRPLSARVRVYEQDVKPECTETGFSRYRCFFQSELYGCTVLELGDAPVLQEGEDAIDVACSRARASDRSAPLAESPLSGKGMTLDVDPEGTRIAWRGGPSMSLLVFYVIGEELVPSPDNETATPPPAPLADSKPDWSKIPTLADRAEALVSRSRPTALPRLLTILEASRGDEAVGRALAHTVAQSSSDEWLAAFKALSVRGRGAYDQEIVAAIEDDPGSTVVAELMESPHLRPPDFADVVAHVAGAELSAGWVEGQNVPALVEALLYLGDARAGTLACTWLEQTVSTSLVDDGDGLPYGLELESGLPALLAIARQKTPCPWVKLALERDPCSLDYRCTANGLVETSDEAVETADLATEEALERGEEEPPLNPQHALCTPAQARRIVDGEKPPWYVPGEDEDEEEPMSSVDPTRTILLSAGHSQGPLPAELVKRNQRRLYRVRDLSKPDGGVGEDATPFCDFTDHAWIDPAEIVCRIPASLNRLTLSGCRIDIDDAQRVITITPPATADGKPVHRPKNVLLDP